MLTLRGSLVAGCLRRGVVAHLVERLVGPPHQTTRVLAGSEVSDAHADGRLGDQALEFGRDALSPEDYPRVAMWKQ